MEPFYYNHMNKNQQAAYRAMQQGLTNLSDEFQHILGNINRNKFISIVNCNCMAYKIRRNFFFFVFFRIIPYFSVFFLTIPSRFPLLFLV